MAAPLPPLKCKASTSLNPSCNTYKQPNPPASPKKARSVAYANITGTHLDAAFMFCSTIHTFIPTTTPSTLNSLQWLANVLQTATHTTLSPKELVAATKFVQLATVLTAPASTGAADKAPNTMHLEVPAMPVPPSPETP
jgi:hypothetical protein